MYILRYVEKNEPKLLHYNAIFDTAQFIDGSKRCMDILKNDHFMAIFLQVLYIFGWRQQSSFSNRDSAMDICVIKRLWCIF